MTPESKLQSIRFPLDLHRRIHELADQDERSFNWIVIHLLRAQLNGNSETTKKSATANDAQER